MTLEAAKRPQRPRHWLFGTFDHLFSSSRDSKNNGSFGISTSWPRRPLEVSKQPWKPRHWRLTTHFDSCKCVFLRCHWVVEICIQYQFLMSIWLFTNLYRWNIPAVPTVTHRKITIPNIVHVMLSKVLPLFICSRIHGAVLSRMSPQPFNIYQFWALAVWVKSTDCSKLKSVHAPLGSACL